MRRSGSIVFLLTNFGGDHQLQPVPEESSAAAGRPYAQRLPRQSRDYRRRVWAITGTRVQATALTPATVLPPLSSVAREIEALQLALACCLENHRRSPTAKQRDILSPKRNPDAARALKTRAFQTALDLDNGRTPRSPMPAKRGMAHLPGSFAAAIRAPINSKIV